MAQHEMVLNFMGTEWDIQYYSDPDEAYIESVLIGNSKELKDCFNDKTIEAMNTALLVKLEKQAAELRTERQLNKKMMYK